MVNSARDVERVKSRRGSLSSGGPQYLDLGARWNPYACLPMHSMSVHSRLLASPLRDNVWLYPLVDTSDGTKNNWTTQPLQAFDPHIDTRACVFPVAGGWYRL
jgi:hypothetical protein